LATLTPEASIAIRSGIAHGIESPTNAANTDIMYAIIVDGGRQYRVEPGMELDLDYREIQSGENITLAKVLCVGGEEGLTLGTPTVEGTVVTASVLGPKQGEKIYVQKFRRRKHSKKRTGHRPLYTRVRIESIGAA